MIENVFALLATQTESVCTAAKFLSKRAHKAARLIVNDYRFSSHAGLVDRVRDVDKALFILRQSVRISPNQPVWRRQPIMIALIGMDTGSDNRQAVARFVRRPKRQWRQRSRERALCTFFQKVSTRFCLHAKSSGMTLAGTTPVNF